MFGGHAEGDGDGLMGGDLRVVVADQGDANFSRRRNSIHLVFLLNSDLRLCRTTPVARELAPARLRSSRRFYVPQNRGRCAAQREQAPSPQEQATGTGQKSKVVRFWHPL